jgi:CYTH domain-containing protein
MEIERERTFLLKYVPKDLEKCESIEIVDIYIPQSAEHPVLRIRKRGDVFEMTKKQPLVGTDSSEQSEHTISLSAEEFEALSKIEGKRFRKRRYFSPFEKMVAEVDVYLDELQGLIVVDFEFKSSQEKDAFGMPDFCLADVTQDKEIAGGMLAGKKYSDIEDFLKERGYEKIIT